MKKINNYIDKLIENNYHASVAIIMYGKMANGFVTSVVILIVAIGFIVSKIKSNKTSDKKVVAKVQVQ